MHKINFDQKIENKKQAVFIIFYALDGKPWVNYPTKPDKANLTIPVCLMVNRSDGWIGFPGGKVDPEETLEQAIKREVKEEIGYKINNPLEKIVAHDIGSITTHAFALKLPFETLKQTQKDAHDADHFGSEISGISLPHLTLYNGQGGQGLAELLKHSLAPSVREELIHFFIRKKIFSKKVLQGICQGCGYSIKELLF